MICLTPECGNEAETRGLCINCYRNASNLIRQGIIAGWEELIEIGMAKEKATNRSRASLFLTEFIKRKNK